MDEDLFDALSDQQDITYQRSVAIAIARLGERLQSVSDQQRIIQDLLERRIGEVATQQEERGVMLRHTAQQSQAHIENIVRYVAEELKTHLAVLDRQMQALSKRTSVWHICLLLLMTALSLFFTVMVLHGRLPTTIIHP